MRLTLTQITLVSILAGCASTTEIAPPPPPAPPAYVQVPHPQGTDTLDVSALFRDPAAPALDTLKDCDKAYQALKAKTNSEDEIRKGVREMVAADPQAYHWCFYGKLTELGMFLKGDSYVDERQKKTLEAYDFLVPVARAYLTEFRDSRYLRYAVTNYRRTSEWVFFRKLELTPEGTSELVDAANPFGLYRTPAEADSILEKYRITSGPVKVETVRDPIAQAAPAEAPAPEAPAAPIEQQSPAEPTVDRAPAAVTTTSTTTTTVISSTTTTTVLAPAAN